MTESVINPIAMPISNMPHAIEIREAVVADNEALLELTRLTPMAGSISLRIDRDPDFFALPRARGETMVFVATCQEKVIGCMSASFHVAYVGGELEKIAHATDLKVHPQFTGLRLAVRLISAIEHYIREQGVDLAFSLVADGNKRMMILAEGRHGTPVEVMLGRFFVEQLIPLPFARSSKRYRLDEAEPKDLPEIAAMLDQRNRGLNFAPPVSAGDLERLSMPALSKPYRRMLVLREQGRIVATLTLEDTQHLRQNVLVGLPVHLRAALAALRVLALPVPRLRVPQIGEPFAIAYVRFLAYAEGKQDAMRHLLSHARAEAFRQRYTFLSLGLHEDDPLRQAVAGVPRLTFTSRAMATSVIRKGRVTGLTDRIPFEDFALV
jgi:GNAT superfamily N-acetyltransferase